MTGECGFNRIGHRRDVAYTIGRTEALADVLLAATHEHEHVHVQRRLSQ